MKIKVTKSAGSYSLYIDKIVVAHGSESACQKLKNELLADPERAETIKKQNGG